MARSVLTRRCDRRRLAKELHRCSDPWQRRKLDILRLLTAGEGPTRIAEIIGCARSTIRSVALAFNAHGFEGLVDQRAQNGRARLMTVEQDDALLRVLAGPAPDGGSWNGRKVHEWLTTTFGIKGGLRHGWSTLVRLSPLVAKPEPKREPSSAGARGPFMVVVVEPVESWHLEDQAAPLHEVPVGRTRAHPPLR